MKYFGLEITGLTSAHSLMARVSCMPAPPCPGHPYEYSLSTLVDIIASVNKLPMLTVFSSIYDLLRIMSYSSLYLLEGLNTVHSGCPISIHERKKKGRSHAKSLRTQQLKEALCNSQKIKT